MELIRRGPIAPKTSYSISAAFFRHMFTKTEECSGPSEAAMLSVEETAAMLAHIIQKLHAKGILSDEDILELLPEFERYPSDA